MIDSSKQQLVDDYLLGRLTLEQMTEFQQKILEDQELAAFFEEQQLLANGIRLQALRKRRRHFTYTEKSDIIVEEDIGQAYRHKRNVEVLSRLKRKEEELERKSNLNNRKISWLGKAASILLAIGIGLWSYSNYSHNQLPEAYFTDYPVSGTKGTTSAAEGILLYKEGKYSEALQALKEVGITETIYPEAQLLQGEILFKYQKNYIEAEKHFDELLNNSILLDKTNQDFKERLEWNKVVSSVALGYTNTPLIASILATPTHKFHKNTLHLMKEQKTAQFLHWTAILSAVLGVLLLFFWLFQRKK